MSQQSNIEWTDATWNPVRGCVKVSPGCANCYAETFAERFRGVKGHPYEQGFDLRLVPEKLTEPLSWKKPRRVFVNSMSDLFQDGVPREFIVKAWAVMQACPQHTFQVLTKRPARMLEILSDPAFEADVEEANETMAGERGWCHAHGDRSFPLSNVWLGVSVENQHFADERIPLLLQTPAAVRFISAEPLLGPVDLTASEQFIGPCEECHDNDPDCDVCSGMRGLDWVIVGGESGYGARPFDLAWARLIVQQCKAAGLACFVKQLGTNPVDGKLSNVELGGAGRPRPFGQPLSESDATEIAGEFGWMERTVPLKSRKGGDMTEWPEDLRVREFPS